MNTFITIIISFGAIAFICWLLWITRNKKVNYTIHQTANKQIEDDKTFQLTKEEFEYLNKLKEKYISGEALSVNDIDLLLEIYKEPELPFRIGSDNYYLYNSYRYVLTHRYTLKNKEINPLNASDCNLNLKNDEVLYYEIFNISLCDSKMTQLDSGSIYITNKNIIFNGYNSNKTYPLKNIFNYKTGYLAYHISISIKNQNNIYFRAIPYESKTILNDAIYELNILLPRFINNNYNKDLI